MEAHPDLSFYQRGELDLKTRCRAQKIYSLHGTFSLFWELKHLHDGFKFLRTGTTLGITDVQLGKGT